MTVSANRSTVTSADIWTDDAAKIPTDVATVMGLNLTLHLTRQMLPSLAH
jgi:hypothetical protein